MDLLKGKVAVVTGATAGIGLDVVRAFVREGATVVLAGRRRPEGEEAARVLGPTASFLPVDVSHETEVADLLHRTVTRHGRLDVLVNNAGSPSHLSGIEHVDAEDFRATQEVNLMGALYGIKHAAAHLRRQGTGGSIINMASITGERVVYAGVAYSVSKAALINLTKWAAAELGRHDIRVNSISPGFISTARFGKAAGVTEAQARGRLDALAAYAREQAGSMQALPRPGSGDDVAGAAVYLAGEASSYVTGHNLVVDGGLSLGQPFEAMRSIREAMAGIFQD
ncbi:SDR family oxidoreductase [Micromonospora sp. WMMD1120]|uniref:SDR family NAD(P)-dependent oxidoreductase n=1 Tax=Micromonospora sp. WMMD1120 TaxID=3016106 RepID=UPI002417EFC3|nr:SDR family oxidoreductase [Micromonospora sp. WMMD1120]MDG4811133.1 SDR family oxidoreductase [Micromonospora sp. WMMD1120]